METILDIVESRVAEDPDRLLYSFLNSSGAEAERLTRAQFLARVMTLASHLGEAHGLRPGDRVLLAYPPGLEMICGFFACGWAGIMPVPVAAPTTHGFQAGLYKMEFIAADCRAKAILTNRATKDLVERQTAGRGIQGHRTGYIASMAWVATDQIVSRDRSPTPRHAGASVLFLQYTSGSTSAPKGVMVTHQNIIANARQVVDHPNPIGVSWLPQHHDMGLIGYYINNALVGGTLYGFSPTTFVQRPSLWLETITKYRATATSAPNFAFEYCLRPGRIPPARLDLLDLSSLELLMAAAEPIKPPVYRDFLRVFSPLGLKRRAFVVAYGLAENTLAVSSYGRRALSVSRQALAKGRAELAPGGEGGSNVTDFMSCGSPLGDTRLLIVDPERRVTLRDGEIGEVWVTGASRCAGYWGDPEATKSTFRARLADPDPAREPLDYLCTGDMGFLHEGELYICGRRKDMIIVRGQNYYPQDIEAVVEHSSAAVRPGCVAAFELGEDAERTIVVVAEVAASKAVPDGLAMLAVLRDTLGIEVDRIVFTSARSVPKTSSGKVMRFEARRMLVEGRFDILGETSTSRRLSSAGVDPEGPFSSLRARYNLPGGEDITIAAVGLDSLELVVLHHELSEKLREKGATELAEGIDIRLIQMLTVKELFELVGRLEADPGTAIGQIRLLLAARRETVRQSEQALMSRDADLTSNAPLDSSELPHGAPHSVLLTGATGFLGPFLLASLLQQTGAVIHALVRSTSAMEGKARLRQALHEAGQGKGQHRDFEDRVVAVPGDLEQDGLGLSPQLWARLAGEIDTVYHNGALVHYLFPYQRMRAANVLGTSELLRLAFEGHRKTFNHISTTFIFGWATKSVLYEHDANAEMAALDFGYSQSKWVAEQLVRKAQVRGLPTRIFRPSLITPSLTGGGGGFDITLRLLSFMIRHGLSVNTLNQVSFTPADITANNIVAISKQPTTINETLHITRDLYTNMPEICAIITRLIGRKFEMVNLSNFVPEVVRRCGTDDPLYPLLNFLVNSADSISAMEFKQYDNSRYRAARAMSPGALPDPSLESTILGILRFMAFNRICSLAMAPDSQPMRVVDG
ncbi:thioester reductase domain-containing protein [Bradyrhizobium sp.]